MSMTKLVYLLPIAWGLTACGSEPEGAGTPRLQLDIFEQATYLQFRNRDIRTAHFLRVRLSTPNGSPVTNLVPSDFTFFRDGRQSSVENATIPTGSLARIDINLCLDNSTSLLDDGNPNDGEDQFVDTVKDQSKVFIQTLRENGFVATLRIFRFSTRSRTELIGAFVASSTSPNGYSPDPNPVLDREIAPTPQDNGTAFFYCLEESFAAVTPGRQTLHIIFSDGVEEGSPPGARQRVLDTITSEQLKVYALGVGNVAPSDLTSVSRFGRSFVRADVSQVGELFADVVKDVQSIYAIVYDTPLQEGQYTLTMNVASPSGFTTVNTGFDAGVDLIRNGYALPGIPGTVIRYDGDRGVTEYRVLDFDQGRTDSSGRFLVGVDKNDFFGPFDGTPDFYVGAFGSGEIRQGISDLDSYLSLPADFGPNREWVLSLPDSQGSRAFVRMRSAGFTTLAIGGEQVAVVPVDVLDEKTDNLLYKHGSRRG